MSSTTLKIQPTQLVSKTNNQVTTTSLIIAETFGKLHKNVLSRIQAIDCSEEFNELNFKPVEYVDKKGETRQLYQITKDGFMFLVMGFTGKKAAAWKEAFINAFNQVEVLQTTSQPKLTAGRTALDKGVKSLVATLKRNGKPATYQDTWKLIHLKTGMENIKQATPKQINDGITYVTEALEGELLQKNAPRTNKPQQDLIKLLNFTLNKFQKVEEAEALIHQAAKLITDARIQTSDLKFNLAYEIKQLTKQQPKLNQPQP